MGGSWKLLAATICKENRKTMELKDRLTRIVQGHVVDGCLSGTPRCREGRFAPQLETCARVAQVQCVEQWAVRLHCGGEARQLPPRECGIRPSPYLSSVRRCMCGGCGKGAARQDGGQGRGIGRPDVTCHWRLRGPKRSERAGSSVGHRAPLFPAEVRFCTKQT